MEHTIPPITHELGRYWEQPDRFEILVDDHHALMTKETFEKLHEYTSSIPTGAYEGKMWRSMQHDGIKYGILRTRPDKPWLLRWYGPCPIPGKVTLNTREVILV